MSIVGAEDRTKRRTDSAYSDLGFFLRFESGFCVDYCCQKPDVVGLLADVVSDQGVGMTHHIPTIYPERGAHSHALI